MTEYTGVIGAGGTASIAPANPQRRRLKYQNQGAATMLFSASATAASATFGLAVPGGQLQIYEWPTFLSGIGQQNINSTLRWPDGGVPEGPITVYGTAGQQYYVEEA
jgi:hypothetical protein